MEAPRLGPQSLFLNDLPQVVTTLLKACSCKPQKGNPRAGPEPRRHSLHWEETPVGDIHSLVEAAEPFPKLKFTGKLQVGTGQWNHLGVAGESLPAQRAPPSPVLPEGSLWQAWGFPEGSQPLPSQDLEAQRGSWGCQGSVQTLCWGPLGAPQSRHLPSPWVI